MATPKDDKKNIENEDGLVLLLAELIVVFENYPTQDESDIKEEKKD